MSDIGHDEIHNGERFWHEQNGDAELSAPE
jgi:hypothetical protein